LPHSLDEINAMARDEFVRVIGPAFEHSPWIAEKTWDARPFERIEILHRKLCRTMREATEAQQLALICAHPDLVGKAVLTSESTGEQTAAGLMDLNAEEVTLFQQYNVKYKERFGFPFIICARLNKKESMLEAFPRRLKNEAKTELSTALAEIEKIASLRLHDFIV